MRLGFHDVSSIWARLGETTASPLGNANLTIAAPDLGRCARTFTAIRVDGRSDRAGR
jgi:hypothetical protein